MEERERLQHRLEEMGYVLFKLGQEDAADMALAAARSVVQDVSILTINPVIEALLDRSLSLYMKAVKEGGAEKHNAQKEASSIVLP